MPELTADSQSIAIVEDDLILREELGFQLEHFGFAVEVFEDAQQFYRRLAVHDFAVVMLDIGLDGEDGLSICQHLRLHNPLIGIVFLTARALRGDRLVGLGAGADSYLTKPVDIDELVLILGRLAERAVQGSSAGTTEVAQAQATDDWRINDAEGLLLAPNGVQIRLSLNELQLLKELMHSRGQVCTQHDLGAALGLLADEFDKHRVEVILSRLRTKVLRDARFALPIQARRGIGYSFQARGSTTENG